MQHDSALEHSQALVQTICQAIKANEGAIDFAHFMHLALYTPGLGYYASGAQKFGAEGDFVTAPEISSLFSQTLAHYCAETLSSYESPTLLEIGAGSGVMASDILLYLEHLGCVPAQYAILEVSPDLQQRQRETLQTRCPHLAKHVTWLTSLPKKPIEGMIIANEVLDAMPVNLFHVNDQGLHERCVTWENAQFAWLDKTPSPLLHETASKLIEQFHLNPPYLSEINLYAIPWLKSLSTCLKNGRMLLIDYGFLQHEYYHPQRQNGTLMCHSRHRNHTDPFFLPGLQDITAHVDFTTLIETANTLGLNVDSFDTQANFLIATGITDLCEQAMQKSPQKQLNLSRQLQTLLFPTEMGELFKILSLST